MPSADTFMVQIDVYRKSVFLWGIVRLTLISVIHYYKLMMRAGKKNAVFLKNNPETAEGALFGINPERLDCVVWRIY
jgi:hypothetical protein